MKSTSICIAGAHRSGTSMLTRLLHVSGLALGPEEDMMPAAADNPDGFWENLRFVRLSDELLNAVGGSWDLPPAETEDLSPDRFPTLQAKAQLLIDSFSNDSFWGWKDPRNCLTLPFWQQLLPNLGIVIIVRNPLEVAYSMNRRNGTSYALGLRLWEIYNRRLLTYSQSDRRIVTDYNSFFQEPERELERIAAFIALPASAIAAAAALVKRDRRHTSFNKEQLIDAGVSAGLIALYESLLAEAAGDKSLSPAVTNSSGAEAADSLQGTRNHINFAVPESETIRRELARRRGDEKTYEEKIAQYQARIEALIGESTRTALEIGRRDGRIQELQTAYAHLDQLLLREQEGRNKLLRHIAHLEQETAQLDKLREEAAQLRDRFAQTNRLLQSYSVQLSDRETENQALTERLRKQLADTKRLLKFLDETEGAADNLRRSRRWILINPFSWLRAKLSHRELRGFGHLDKIVSKYKSWRSGHPELENLEGAMAVLRSRQIHVPSAAELEKPLPEKVEKRENKPAPPSRPIEFPSHQQVEVSVIIPVYNQIDFTLACLASLQEHQESYPFEVIVVDDCSTDETQSKLKNIPGLTYLRKERNSGFTASCNLGAERARAPYLFFLNNDTTVATGWLDQLRRTFDYEPKAGLVGSKLVYPDGRLQEAGGIIWRDASGWNRGKFQDPRRPEFNFLREVDYCSAASVMIPKSLFDSLGGFDSKYSPAYYEDTDLAFKVCAAGRKVLYQPLSVITHFEGATSGTDLASGAKKHQATNRSIFAESWKEVLETKPVNGDIATWDSLQPEKKRILVIDHHLPMPDRDSGSLRMSQILTILHRLGHRVTFLPDNLADIPPYGDQLRGKGIEVVHHPYVRSVREFLRERGREFDAVILSRCDFARKHIDEVRASAPDTYRIFDTVDLHFLRTDREAQLTEDSAIREQAVAKEEQELYLLDQADETWVVSDVEQRILQQRRPEAKIEVVSNIVDVPGSAAPFSLRQDFLFIGSFQHTPNIDAVIWFTQSIIPLVRPRLPEAKFYIIGDKAPPEIIALANETIVVTGRQPDVSLYFNNVKLSVAPLRFGAGVKGKVNQSMGFGVPVIATDIAVEGMGLTNRKHAMIANEPEAFAEALVEVYEDEQLWQRLSDNAIQLTRERFSRETATKTLTRLFESCHRTVPEPANA